MTAWLQIGHLLCTLRFHGAWELINEQMKYNMQRMHAKSVITIVSILAWPADKHINKHNYF